MKKLALLAFALMVLTLTQCKKEEIDNTTTTGEEKMVKLTLSIPVDDGSKTDFIDYDNGTIGINWNRPQPDSHYPEKVYEYIYLVIPSEFGGIVPMEGRYKNYPESNVLTFEANWHFNIPNLDLNNTKFDVWYLGDSGNNRYEYINDPTQYTVSGSINNQTGKLEDLGKYHIAKGYVKFLKVNENEYTLSMAQEDYFKSQVAIAKINMNDISQISGNAIVGTEFQLVKSHNDNGIFRITPSKTINLTDTDENSQYLVFFPKTAEEGFSSSLYETIVVEGKNCIKRSYKFANAVEANNVYHVNGGCLPWREAKNDKYYEYVDLGLPSGTLWSTDVVKIITGGNIPVANIHFRWGEVEPYSTRIPQPYYFNNDIPGELTDYEDGIYDAARHHWGAWRLPTEAEVIELINHCTEWEDLSEYIEEDVLVADYFNPGDLDKCYTAHQHRTMVKYKVTGPNGQSIILNQTGDWKSTLVTIYVNNGWMQNIYHEPLVASQANTTQCGLISYWTSTPDTQNGAKQMLLTSKTYGCPGYLESLPPAWGYANLTGIHQENNFTDSFGEKGVRGIFTNNRHHGASIRPVI